MSTLDPRTHPEEDTMSHTEPIPTQPATIVPPPAAPERSGPRVTTVVWGLVVAAIGAGFLAVALGATFDLELAAIIVIAAAGAAIVVGSLFRSRR